MARFFLGALVVAGLYGSSASAADLTSRAIVHVAPAPVAFTWTGFHIGAHAGATLTDSQHIQTFGNDSFTALNILLLRRPPSLYSESVGAALGGGIGYDYQFTPGRGLVLGVAADVTWTDLHKDILHFGMPVFPGTPPVPNGYRQNLSWVGTALAKVGYAFDDIIVYGLGGFAYGAVTYESHFYNPLFGNALAYVGRFSDTETGYAFGGGIEYALPLGGVFHPAGNSGRRDLLSIKIEAVRYDLGHRDILVAGGLIAASVGSYGTRYQTQGVLLGVGLNYRFDIF